MSAEPKVEDQTIDQQEDIDVIKQKLEEQKKLVIEKDEAIHTLQAEIKEKNSKISE